MIMTNVKHVESNTRTQMFFENTYVTDDLIEFKCLCCSKNYQKVFDENLKKRSASTYKFSNHDINKFILMLRKDFYPYE